MAHYRTIETLKNLEKITINITTYKQPNERHLQNSKLTPKLLFGRQNQTKILKLCCLCADISVIVAV